MPKSIPGRRWAFFVAAEKAGQALAINQHLHLVKGAEWDKGIGIAKKGVGSLTITNYFSYPPLTLDVPLKPTLVINCSEASNLCETAPRPLSSVLPSLRPSLHVSPTLSLFLSRLAPPPLRVQITLRKALLLSSTRAPQVLN